MSHKMIQVGTGGWGNAWCRRFLPPNAEEGLIEVVAAVDTDPDALVNATEQFVDTARFSSDSHASCL